MSKPILSIYENKHSISNVTMIDIINIQQFKTELQHLRQGSFETKAAINVK
jgi:hypothetical protein